MRVGQMIHGFDAAVADMEVGQTVDVHLMPEEAYGMPDPDAIFTVEIAQLPARRICRWISRCFWPISRDSRFRLR